MLKDSLYNIKKIFAEKDFAEALLELNAQHEIFKGHFPSQPVLPGACILQMTKEILQTALNIKLQLINAEEIKFLQMIEPTGEHLQFLIQYNFTENSSLKLSAKIIVNEVVCCKMKALFQLKK